jgi:hypothetical protein
MARQKHPIALRLENQFEKYKGIRIIVYNQDRLSFHARHDGTLLF